MNTKISEMTLKDLAKSLNERYDLDYDGLKKTVDELCANGVAKGCYDTLQLCATLEMLSIMEQVFKQM